MHLTRDLVLQAELLALQLPELERVKPRQAVLTNMHIDLDYQTVSDETPDHIVAAYDGLTLSLPV